MGISGFQAGKKLKNDIFFNKKRRKELKQTFLKGQRLILETSDFSVKPVLEQEYAKRHLETSVLAFTVKGLETIKKAEDFYIDTYLAKCKFKLFQKGKSVLIKSDFEKPLKNQKKTTFVLFPNGLPNKNKKKAFIFKDRYEFEGYKLIDKGVFRQKILNFEEFQISFKGENFKDKIILKVIDRNKFTYWARIEIPKAPNPEK